MTNCSLVGGYRLVYDRKCTVKFVVEDPEMIEKIGDVVSSMEEVQVKISVRVSRLPSGLPPC